MKICNANLRQKNVALKIYNSANQIDSSKYIEASDKIFDAIFNSERVFFLTDNDNYIGLCSYGLFADHAFLSSLYIALPWQRHGQERFY